MLPRKGGRSIPAMDLRNTYRQYVPQRRLGRLLTYGFIILVVILVLLPYRGQETFKGLGVPSDYSYIMSAPKRLVTRNGYYAEDPSETDHPLTTIIRLSKKEWQKKLEGQSRSLREVVEEYQRRYGRPPPKGLDHWWKYVVENRIFLPDEYDQIHRDMIPFIGFQKQGVLMEKLQDAKRKMDHLMSIKIENGQIVETATKPPEGGMHVNMRLRDQLTILENFAQFLPDVEILVNAHDGPRVFVHHQTRQDLADCALGVSDCSVTKPVMGEVGWFNSCPPDSAINDPAINSTGGKFVVDRNGIMNFCDHPYTIPLHAFLGPRRIVGEMSPTMALCKFDPYGDILLVPFEEVLIKPMAHYPWEEKTTPKMVWRGSTTGGRWSLNSHEDPRAGQRQRLVAFNNLTGPTEMTFPGKNQGKQWRKEMVDAETAVNHYLDVAFIGDPVQCFDGACDMLRNEYKFDSKRMTPATSASYRYVIDVDGNGWSGRFKALLSSGSVVFKQSLIREWWSERSQPWVHYIPINMEYSDLLDIMAYFEGDLSGNGGHQNAARQIADAGTHWARDNMRFEDMVAWNWRVYLEWARLQASEGTDSDLHYTPEMEVD